MGGLWETEEFGGIRPHPPHLHNWQHLVSGNYTALPFIALHCSAVHCSALHCTRIYNTALLFNVIIYCTALRFTAKLLVSVLWTYVGFLTEEKQEKTVKWKKTGQLALLTCNGLILCGINRSRTMNINWLDKIYIYGRTCLNGYLTKQLGVFDLLYVHILDYSTTFKLF